MSDIINKLEKVVLSIAYYTNWFCGIGIIEYPIGKQHRVMSFLYTGVVLIVYSVLSVYVYSDFAIVSRDYEVNQTMMKGVYCATFILTFSTIVMGWYRNKEIRSILQRMNIAMRIIDKLGASKNYTKAFTVQVGYAVGTLTFLIIIVIINALVVYKRDPKHDSHVLTVMAVNYPLIILQVVDTLFINIIQYARKNMRVINDVLREMLTSTQDFPQHTKIVRRYLRTLDSPELDTDIVDQKTDAEDKMYTINMSKKAHLTLVKICQETDDTFGLHILLSVIVAIITITVSIYHIYMLVDYLSISRAIYDNTLLPVCILLIYYYVKIHAISHFCSSTSEEAVITGDIISELYDDSSIGIESQTEIRQFGDQIVQNSLTFKAHGFVTLDFTLIQNVKNGIKCVSSFKCTLFYFNIFIMLQVVGFVTTYLMILIQFGSSTSIEISR
ncbi:gustatory receptor 53 isoform X1 [Nasonia vitripennis]|uniref:Gustatory receptor n=1 Tax=Nasonia vitripennis TaxID=7425 RepID=A0A7M7QJY6_NASVI|nr:gustatory receptor 53 isoform X1 [Nasonia vitripennis]